MLKRSALYIGASKGLKMISQINAGAIRTAYQSSETSSKTEQKSVEKQGDTSKIETLKKAIADGDYKVNLGELAEKIADELL